MCTRRAQAAGANCSCRRRTVHLRARQGMLDLRYTSSPSSGASSFGSSSTPPYLLFMGAGVALELLERVEPGGRVGEALCHGRGAAGRHRGKGAAVSPRRRASPRRASPSPAWPTRFRAGRHVLRLILDHQVGAPRSAPPSRCSAAPRFTLLPRCRSKARACSFRPSRTR